MNLKEEIHENKISKICSQNNYNSPEQEHLQSRFERAFASILKDVIETPDPADIDLNLKFLKFVGFMLGNNIKKRKNMAELISSFELQIEGLDGNHKILIDDDYRSRFDLSLAFANAFYEKFKSWNFIRREIGDKQKTFITSDNPVSIFNPENLLTPTYIGIKCKDARLENFGDTIILRGERGIKAEASFTLESVSFQKDVIMIFPITPISCLVGFSDSDRYVMFRERTMRSPDINNELINTITFRYSNKAAYSPTKERLKEAITQLPRVLSM